METVLGDREGQRRWVRWLHRRWGSSGRERRGGGGGGGGETGVGSTADEQSASRGGGGGGDGMEGKWTDVAHEGFLDLVLYVVSSYYAVLLTASIIHPLTYMSYTLLSTCHLCTICCMLYIICCMLSVHTCMKAMPGGSSPRHDSSASPPPGNVLPWRRKAAVVTFRSRRCPRVRNLSLCLSLSLSLCLR